MASTNDVSNLDSEARRALQHLISINIDSEKGFQQAAQDVKDAQLKSFFEEMSSVRHRNATELQRFVAEAGTEPTDHGSVSANLHRWWISAKQHITSGNSESVLNEAERGEDSIKHEYERHLEDLEGSPAEGVVRQQFDNVKQGHDRVKQLRNRYKNPA